MVAMGTLAHTNGKTGFFLAAVWEKNYDALHFPLCPFSGAGISWTICFRELCGGRDEGRWTPRHLPPRGYILCRPAPATERWVIINVTRDPYVNQTNTEELFSLDQFHSKQKCKLTPSVWGTPYSVNIDGTTFYGKTFKTWILIRMGEPLRRTPHCWKTLYRLERRIYDNIENISEQVVCSGFRPVSELLIAWTQNLWQV